MYMLSSGVCVETYIDIDIKKLQSLFGKILVCAESWDPKALLIGNISAGEIALACKAVLTENIDLTIGSSDNSIKVKTWAVTPPSFEELWGPVEDSLNIIDKQTISIIKEISHNIYLKFYKSIKEQLEK